MRAARTARLFFLIQPITLLFSSKGERTKPLFLLIKSTFLSRWHLRRGYSPTAAIKTPCAMFKSAMLGPLPETAKKCNKERDSK